MAGQRCAPLENLHIPARLALELDALIAGRQFLLDHAISSGIED
jgi:hypothetical protein